MEKQQLKSTLEAILFSANDPLSSLQLEKYFDPKDQVNRADLKATLVLLQQQYHHSGIELKQVQTGYRFQTRQEYKYWVAKHTSERTPKYSRALLETLAIIAYQQPTTRAEIEAIRGVTVSSNIIKTLEERQWIRVLGHKEVPGRPAMFGTSREFLDYFNLKSLNELPKLSDLVSVKDVNFSLNLEQTT